MLQKLYEAQIFLKLPKNYGKAMRHFLKLNTHTRTHTLDSLRPQVLTDSTDDAGEPLGEGARVNVQGAHMVHLGVGVGGLQLHGRNLRHLQESERRVGSET